MTIAGLPNAQNPPRIWRVAITGAYMADDWKDRWARIEHRFVCILLHIKEAENLQQLGVLCVIVEYSLRSRRELWFN